MHENWYQGFFQVWESIFKAKNTQKSVLQGVNSAWKKFTHTLWLQIWGCWRTTAKIFFPHTAVYSIYFAKMTVFFIYFYFQPVLAKVYV